MKVNKKYTNFKIILESWFQRLLRGNRTVDQKAKSEVIGTYDKKIPIKCIISI